MINEFSEFHQYSSMFGLASSKRPYQNATCYYGKVNSCTNIKIICSRFNSELYVLKNNKVIHCSICKCVDSLIRKIDKIYSSQCIIRAANNSRDMVRVKSSNVWGFNIRIKDRKSGVGDVFVQFKSEQGGPGDVYVYYDVPVRTYRRWQTAPSKGHFFWQYIRNFYKYSKLTGDKRGKLANAIN